MKCPVCLSGLTTRDPLVAKLRAKCDALRAEVERLREALAFVEYQLQRVVASGLGLEPPSPGEPGKGT